MQNSVTFIIFEKECNRVKYCKSIVYIFGYTGYTTFANFQECWGVYAKKYILHICVYIYMKLCKK